MPGSLTQVYEQIPGIPLAQPVTVAAVHPLGSDLPVAGVAAHLDIGVHHPLRKPLDHLPQQVRARRCQRLLELRAGNRRNVTCGRPGGLRMRSLIICRRG